MKVGRLLELNDPLDCQPVFVNAPASLSAADRDAKVQECLGTFNDIVGVFCYSEAITDPVVWTHYADGHWGMALGFELDMLGFRVFPVKYPDDNARPPIDFEQLGDLNPEDRGGRLLDLIGKAFAVKAKSWEYERERRCFVYLGRRGIEVSGRRYFMKIAPLTFKRIVLGVRSTLSILDVQRCIARKSFAMNAKVSKATTSDTSFELIA